MYFSLRNILIIISLSFISVLKAQIYSDISKSRPVLYPDSGTPDSLFVFSVEDQTKSIVAHLPDSARALFEWSYYSPEINDYILIDSDSAEVWVIDTISSNSGYRLVINNGEPYYCWVIIHDFKVDITSTPNDTISNSDINCRTISYIKAEMVYNPDQFYYNPFVGAEPVKIKYNPSWDRIWGSDQPDADDPGPNGSLQASVENPYWKDTWYNITVTNRDTKQKSKDSVFYKSVRPHAEFIEPRAIPLDDSVFYPDKEEWYKNVYNSTTYKYKSAPALYLFDNDSSGNADEYTWIFGDSITTQSGPDTLMQHVYELPGTYYAYLIAKKNVDFLYDPCYDTFPKIESEEYNVINKIEIDDPQNIDSTQIPNVFTSKHEFGWRFNEDVSIDDFEIAIFNRFGHRVYHFKGNIRDWSGWDGTYRKKKVSTGVYFFVVKGIRPLPDFETEELPADLILVKKGFIHYYNLED